MGDRNGEIREGRLNGQCETWLRMLRSGGPLDAVGQGGIRWAMEISPHAPGKMVLPRHREEGSHHITMEFFFFICGYIKFTQIALTPFKKHTMEMALGELWANSVDVTSPFGPRGLSCGDCFLRCSPPL